MEQRTEQKTGFFGTYFDRDIVLRFSRLIGVFAWVVLGMYLYTILVSAGQFWWAVTYGGASYEGVNIFDKLSIPTMQISQLIPAIVHVTLLKTAQYALLILLDVEDNSRRATRSIK